jgi:sialate O-acetylesterase
MVLPRNISVPIFGLGVPGSTVEVEFGVFRAQALVRPEGVWRLKMPPAAAGGPHVLKMRSGGQEVVVRDVMVGDVWLASGQSNMEWPVARSREAADIRKEITPQIRCFKVVQASSSAPEKEIRGNWTVGSKDTVNKWSAVATSFALEVQKTVKVPIGIIQATWGGTKIESWMSQSSMESNPKLRPIVDEYIASLSGYRERLSQWQESVNQWDSANEKKDPGNQGFDKGWGRREFDDSSWSEVALPTPWEQIEGRDVDGAVWYRHHFTLPKVWKGKGIRLELGFVGTDDSSYVNGLKVGATMGRFKPRAYYVGPGVLREGENVIAIRVWNRSGEGGLLGPDIKLTSVDGGASMDLNTTWKTRNEQVIEPPSAEEERRPIRPMGPGDRNAPSGAFHGMIAPLIPYGIKGILWYQGEANVGAAPMYGELFPAMITDWRARWKEPALPFFYVQLPGYGKTSKPEKAEWAELREAQESALRLPMTGMAPSIDLGDAETIHPIRKREVGRRLAGFALSRVYRKGTPSFCPTVISAKREAGHIRIVFQDAYGALKTRDGYDLSGLEVLEEDGNWAPASAQILRNQLLVSGDVKGVRYLWADNPSGNLVNAVGLPVAPFRILL